MNCGSRIKKNRIDFGEVLILMIVVGGAMLPVMTKPVLAQTTQIPIGYELSQLIGGNPFKVDNLSTLIEGVVEMLLIVAGVITFACIVWSGVQWINAGGDKGAVQMARERLTQCVIGLVIVVTALALMNILRYFLGADTF
jgi:hypothetical protein